jgi:O-acetyl-ADP-ribose deacetylase (regulator of RNase III)
MPFSITRDDIAKLNTDAIVNSTGGLSILGGVEAAISVAGGPEFVAAREALGELLVGETKVTPGFDLSSRYVIHVRGPIYKVGSKLETSLLELVYLDALSTAEKLGCQSIAFPLIGSGAHNFPRGVAMDIALGAIRKFLDNSEMMIHLVIYNRSSYLIRLATKREFDDYLSLGNQHNAPHVMYAIDRKVSPRMRRQSQRSAVIDEYQQNVIPGLSLRPEETFSESTLRLIDQRGLNDVEVYKQANIDRKLFSKIRSSREYQPSKNTVILLALALHLNLDETKDLLEKAGFALSPSSKFDLIIEYCIDNDIYDIFKINQVLFAYTSKALVGI